MRYKTKISLHNALWLVIGIATVPVFLLILNDYQTNREEVIRGIKGEVRTMLVTARSEEQSAVHQAQLLLQIMAGANEMQGIDAEACNALARRLLKTTDDFSNIGAVLPNGDVFCSGLPNDKALNISDRQWFKSAKLSETFGLASFIVGHISGLPSLIFSRAVREFDGTLRSALYVGSQPLWFDQLVERFQLKAGWEATLMTRSGRIITHYPMSDRWRLKQADPAVLRSFGAAFDQPEFVGELSGFDGISRFYGVAPLASTGGDVFVVIGAPVDRSLAQVNRNTSIRLLTLLLVTVLSVFFARFFIYRLTESSINTIRSAVARLAKGDLDTRVRGLDAVEEFNELGDGFNAMAEAMQRREAELHRLSSAIEQSPESVVMTDLDAKIIYVNQAFTKVTGFTPAEVIGQNPRVLQSGNTSAETYGEMWATLGRRQVWRGELTNKRKDGSFYEELATIAPIMEANGRVSHYVAIKQDISATKRIAAELEEHRNHLEALVNMRTWELSVAKSAAEVASRAKSAFLASMSHEIRTPLNAILGMGYLLGESPLSPDQHDKVDKIASAGKHLLQVINDILDLAKIEAGRVELRLDVFNPAAVVQEVGSLISEGARKKGLSIHIDAETLPQRVAGDETRLRQALLNLAGNAVKFTTEGSITLRGEILVEDSAHYDLRFTVDDTGPGIAPPQLFLLFTAFEQLDKSTSRDHGGTGLGLVITRHLAHLMGGEVGVESVLGKGSRFWLKIRVDRSSASPAKVSMAPAFAADEVLRRRLPATKVLLAEDEPVNRELAIELLTAVGCQVDAAVDGEEAAKMAASGDYDLILMDIQMPVLDGFAATELIRRQPRSQKTPVLAMTANVMVEDRERCIKHGMNDFIPKPVDPEQLYATLLRWLPEQESDALRPSASTTGYVPLPADELALAVRHLATALDSGDLEASIVFSEMEVHLQRVHGKALAPLKEAIGRFDYEAARRLLDELADG